MSTRFPPLGDLASIGDRRTAALIDREATVCWYSPHRIDHPSLFNALLDPRRGAWRVSLPGATPRSRRYIGASAVLETRLALYDAELVVTDWLTMGRSARPGLFCRTFSRAPGDVTILLDAWPGGRHRGLPVLVDGVAVFEDGLHLFASQPLKVDDRGVHWTLPRGQAGWAVLSDGACDRPRAEDLDAWKTATIERWEELGAKTTYDGPYRAEVAASLRQLRLLVYEPTGAIAAAITAGLPEVLGGRRNYDYRYSWLRDTGMVVRALLKTASAGAEGEAFLSFIALAREHASRPPLDVVVAIATMSGAGFSSERTRRLRARSRARSFRGPSGSPNIGQRAATQLLHAATSKRAWPMPMISDSFRKRSIGRPVEGSAICLSG